MLALPVCTDVFSNGRNVCERAKDGETIFVAFQCIRQHRRKCIDALAIDIDSDSIDANSWTHATSCEKRSFCSCVRVEQKEKKKQENSKWLSPRARARASQHIFESRRAKILHTKNNPFNLHRERARAKAYGLYVCLFGVADELCTNNCLRNMHVLLSLHSWYIAASFASPAS